MILGIGCLIGNGSYAAAYPLHKVKKKLIASFVLFCLFFCLQYNNSLLWNLKSVQEIYYGIILWITAIYNDFSRFKKWAVPEW